MEYLWTPWRSTYVTKQKSEGNCIFCDAVAGNEDQKHLLVFRAKNNFVILNRFPYSSGHLMIAPNDHVSKLAHVDTDTADELIRLARFAEVVLGNVYRPHGINIGMNVGEAAGAGIAAHLHLHVLPRWTGDANFMSVVGNTRVMPELLEDTYEKLRPEFEQYRP
jgi:ATP adenylyltransferase